MAGRTNTVLQTCFFAISGVLPREIAIDRIKKAIVKTYGRRGAEVVERNQAAVDRALEGLHRVEVPEKVTATADCRRSSRTTCPSSSAPSRPRCWPAGETPCPVSALPVDGTYPSGTAAYEKRNIARVGRAVGCRRLASSAAIAASSARTA